MPLITNQHFINQNILINKNNNIVSIILDVPSKAPLQTDYCLPTTIDMVFSYIGRDQGFSISQHVINDNLQQQMVRAVTYMNDISHRYLFNIDFDLLNIPENYGNKKNDMLLFQQYITNSLVEMCLLS